jgi:glycine oxidase
MTNHPDMLVIGGGVIGLTTAYLLAQEGARVELIDKGEFGQEASWAGAGIIPPGNPARAETDYDRLRAESSAMFASLSADLRERTGIDNGYRVCGGVQFLSREDEYLVAAWRHEGIAHHRMTPADLAGLEPGLAADAPGGAYHLPATAQVRNPRHVRALVKACEGAGVALRPNCPVWGFKRERGRIAAALTLAGDRAAGAYLIAGGAWSDGLLESFGLSPGIRPVRGQIVLLAPPAPLFRNILEVGKCYLVPREDGRVLAGSTEEDVGFDKRTTSYAVAELIAFACSLVPALADAHVERCWAGLRPGSPDGMPFLGPIPGCPNGFLAAGHFRCGIQLSPGTARVMADWIRGRPPSLPVEAFRPDRRPGEPARAAFRS